MTHEIARPEQQIEEVERAGPRLELVVAVDRAAQVALQQRGELRVGGHAELIETRLERDPRLEDPSRVTPSAYPAPRPVFALASVRSFDRSTSAASQPS